ncbi:MAG: hypothetical protein P8104_08955 [Gammaproteobacteria bacterium]
MNVNKLSVVFLFVTVSAFAADAQLPVRAYLYKYTDAEGALYIGRQIPPENYKYGYTALDEFGEVVEVVPPAPTPEEREAYEAEIRRQAEEKLQQQKDEQLLKTYSSSLDAINARDRKLAQVDVTIDITQAKLASFRVSYDRELESAAEAERAGKEPDARTLRNMKDIEQSMADLEAHVLEKQNEKILIHKEFEPLVARLKEIEAESKGKKAALNP